MVAKNSPSSSFSGYSIVRIACLVGVGVLSVLHLWGLVRYDEVLFSQMIYDDRDAIDNTNNKTTIIDTSLNLGVAPPLLSDKYIVSREQFSLLYGIFCRAKDFEIRSIIRSNHLYETPSRYNIDVYFILGEDVTGDYDHLIHLENETYGDLIVLPNTPENMNRGKTYSYFSHIATHWNNKNNRSWTSIGKFDADTYTHFDSYYRFLLLNQIRSQVWATVSKKGGGGEEEPLHIRWDESIDFYYWWNLGIENEAFGSGNVSWLQKTQDAFWGFPVAGPNTFSNWTAVEQFMVPITINELKKLDNSSASYTEEVRAINLKYDPRNPNCPLPFYIGGLGYGMSMEVSDWIANKSSFASRHPTIRGEDATTTHWMYADKVGNNLWLMEKFHLGIDHHVCYVYKQREGGRVPGYCDGRHDWWTHNRSLHVHSVKTIDRWANISTTFYPGFELKHNLNH